MIVFEVKDMSCGHCVSTITKALKATDKDAKVTIDLAQHLVMVEPTDTDIQALRDAIAEAGYTPVAVPVQAAPGDAKPASTGGCCGGCG